jgi:hypothetical protein
VPREFAGLDPRSADFHPALRALSGVPSPAGFAVRGG